jgi:hypothetical protein
MASEIYVTFKETFNTTSKPEVMEFIDPDLESFRKT